VEGCAAVEAFCGGASIPKAWGAARAEPKEVRTKRLRSMMVERIQYPAEKAARPERGTVK